MVDTKPYGEVTPIGRAIYYVLGVSSLFSLTYSNRTLWPSKREDGSLVEIPNSKYVAVVLTSLYAIGLARTLFSDRPPPSHKIGRQLEWFFPFCLFITVFLIAFTYRSDPEVIFFVTSVITCGISILQLSHPVEEFYVGKSVWVIVMSGLVGMSFSSKGGQDLGMGFFAGFSSVYLGVWSMVLLRDP
ncbi:unnamed protein product [Microthlaspi erraticum]|uniref:Uncharacterized protein n=1 Tax=Microthlaspi erraticum TaxID=1685480 RepID=A0A6D2HJA7_9BRAS|nr:unnamed protein product [Microthlaspi erraticum]